MPGATGGNIEIGSMFTRIEADLSPLERGLGQGVQMVKDSTRAMSASLATTSAPAAPMRAADTVGHLASLAPTPLALPEIPTDAGAAIDNISDSAMRFRAVLRGAFGEEQTDITRGMSARQIAAAEAKAAALEVRNAWTAQARTFSQESNVMMAEMGNMGKFGTQTFSNTIASKIFGSRADRAAVIRLTQDYNDAVQQGNTVGAEAIKVERGKIQARYEGSGGAARAAASQFVSSATSMAMMVPQIMAIQLATQAFTEIGSAVFIQITDPMRAARQATADLGAEIEKTGGASKFLARGVGGSTQARTLADQIAAANKYAADAKLIGDFLAQGGAALGGGIDSMKGRAIAELTDKISSGIVPAHGATDTYATTDAQAAKAREVAVLLQQLPVYVEAYDKAWAGGATRMVSIQVALNAVARAAVESSSAFATLGNAITDAMDPDKVRAQVSAWSFEDAKVQLGYFNETAKSAIDTLAKGKPLTTEQTAAMRELNGVSFEGVTIAGLKVAADQLILDTMDKTAAKLAYTTSLSSVQHQMDIVNGSGKTLTAHEREAAATDATTRSLNNKLHALDRTSAATDRLRKLAQLQQDVDRAGVAMAGQTGFDVAAQVLEARAQQKTGRADIATDDKRGKIQGEIDLLAAHKDTVDKSIQLDTLQTQYADLVAAHKLTQARADAQTQLGIDQELATSAETIPQRQLTAWETTKDRQIAVWGELGAASGMTYDELIHDQEHALQLAGLMDNLGLPGGMPDIGPKVTGARAGGGYGRMGEPALGSSVVIAPGAIVINGEQVNAAVIAAEVIKRIQDVIRYGLRN